QLAVDVGADMAAVGDDFVIVPFAFLDVRFARFLPQQRSAVLFVQLAPPALANVGLIAADFALGQAFAAELNAAVFLIRRQFYFQGQAEVVRHHVTAQEFVAFQPLAAANDFAILDAPQIGIAVPAG